MAQRDPRLHILQDGRVEVDSFRLGDHHRGLRLTGHHTQRIRGANIAHDNHLHKCDRPQPVVTAPRMNIAILITGSRGDVQPFVALGKKLQTHGHRVRIGTHGIFRSLVVDNGLEFYSIGGDPEQLMAYMVKNPGILPSMESVRAGDIGSRKAELEEMLVGAWRACTEASDDDCSSDESKNESKNYSGSSLPRSFVADAIISNPPTYASLHIAERLAIPLHYMFTMPWSPTTAFPHPLAQMDSSKTDAGRRNYLSYPQIEMLTWVGLADIVNSFRRRTLQLAPIEPTWGVNLISHLKVPYTYCWSPALIPKPADWGKHIGISGFFFLPSGSTYKPDPELQAFLDAGEPPVYIGFGSIVVDDPDSFTKLILEAVKKAGVRALVSKGWSKVGGSDVPDNVMLLGNVPHDWLFQHVSAVVHHGGAGTCAIGLALGRPTVIVPFFGDQFWWAGIVERAGAGPHAVPYKKLTADALADNIRKALEPDMRAKANELSQKMKGEDGVTVAVDQFHDLQQVHKYACFLCPERVGVWRVRRTNVQLSALAVAILTKHGRIQPRHLKLVRHKRWYAEEGAPAPLLGAMASVVATARNCADDIRNCKRNIARSRNKKTANREQVEERTSPESAKVPQSTTSSLAQLSCELAVEGVTAPVNFFYQVANGFHNAPSTLFHDTTVRIREPPITDIPTGLLVAGKEVVFGAYDGITGLARHPISGFKNGHGRSGGPAWGLAKGIGRGVGGVVCRAGAIGFGVLGYPLKGVEMQCRTTKGETMDQQAEVSAPPRLTESFGDTEKTEQDAERRRFRMQWAKACTKHPILQKRVVQALRELYEAEVESGQSELERTVLETWDGLVEANGLRIS